MEKYKKVTNKDDSWVLFLRILIISFIGQILTLIAKHNLIGTTKGGIDILEMCSLSIGLVILASSVGLINSLYQRETWFERIKGGKIR